MPVEDPPAPGRLIAPSLDDLRTAFAPDADVWAAIERIGPCRLRGDDGLEPYEALLRAIAGQQLHGRAARAIFGRLCALTEDRIPGPAELLAHDEQTLRGCGLSGAKIVAMRGVAEARLDGRVPSRAEADELDDETIVRKLVTLRGVGRWTVEMLLMFTLGRPDVMPVDDFGVREGWRRIKGYDAPVRPKALGLETAMFSPWRSALAWYCWRASEEGKKAADVNPLTG
jgi:DNA-3-methyladenine glycosylase II